MAMRRLMRTILIISYAIGVAEGNIINASEEISYPLACRDHSECRLAGAWASYCYVGTSNFIQHASDSTCLGCWACCLYKDHFPAFQDSCPAWCKCSQVGACSASEDCAAGHFCSQLLGTCRPCHECASDASVPGSGECIDTCPYGPTGALTPLFAALPSMKMSFDYLSYQGNDAFRRHSPGSELTSPGVRVDAFADWLEELGIDLQGDRAQYLFVKFDADNDSLLTVTEYVDKRLQPGDHLCHAPEDMDQAPLAFAGCSCNPIASPAVGACPSGFTCSHAGDGVGETHGDSSERFLTTTLARCFPCAPGEFCPGGTYTDPSASPNTQIMARRCPPGSYCPNPSERVSCEAGTYCVGGSLEPFSCNLGGLVQQDALADVPQPTQTLLEQLYEKGDPLGGNFCPEQAVTPAGTCAPGYFCPNASLQIICPEGSFCPEQSKHPRACIWLTWCPEGTVRPELSLGAFVFVAAAAAIMMASFVYVRRAAAGQRARAAKAAEQELLNMVKTLLVRLGRTYGDNTQRSFMVEPMVRIQFKGVGMLLKGSNRWLLENVSGVYNPGHLHAIMGPSGCGKTSLLTALSGKAVNGRLQGIIRYNGEAMAPHEVRELVGYVPQDDIVHEDLTVLENLYLAKNLRGGFKEAKEGHTIVNEVLDDLYLTRVKDSVVGSAVARGISGGQRKRVNIALEVVGMPSILYLDEPTSGLDATSSIDVLRALSRLSGCGMNVVTVIHQPRYSLYELLDSLLLLGVGGVTVYNGPPLLTERYFGRHGFAMQPHDNVADFNLDVVSGRVSKAGDPMFAKESLPALWELHGQEFLNAHGASDNTAWRESFRLPPEVRRRLGDEFAAADKDDSGTLDAAELSALFTKLGIVVPPAVFQNVTSDLGDGRGQVTCAQLLAALEGVPEDAASRPPASSPTASPSPHSAALDSVSVQNPSASVSGAMDGSDRTGAATELSASALAHQAPLSPGSSLAPSDEFQQQAHAVPSAAVALRDADSLTDPSSRGSPSTGPLESARLAPRPMAQGSLSSTAFTAASLFSPERDGRRSGSWSLSDAESMPALPAAGIGLGTRTAPEPLVAVDNVTFEMQSHLSGSASVPASDDGITISGVVPGAARGAQRSPLGGGAATGSSGLPPGSMSASWAQSQGLSQTQTQSDFLSQRTDTSALVDGHVVRGTVDGFLDSTYGGRGVAESVERPRMRSALWPSSHGHPAASAARRVRVPPSAALPQGESPARAVAEGVVFDTDLSDSAEISQQLHSHPGPANTPRSRSRAARTLFGSGARSRAAAAPTAAELMASDHNGPMSKSMAAGTMRKMLQSVGDTESGLLGSVRDGLAAKAAPNQLLQLLLIVKRTALKRFRDFFPTTVIDISLLLLAACVVGAIHGTDWELHRSPGNTVMVATTLCTLTSATFLRSFTRDQQMYWREASKGLQTLPYFLGISFVDMYYVILAPLLFVGPYWHLTLPSASITTYYLVCFAVTFWGSGVAYMLSAVLPVNSVLVGTVFTCLIVGAFLSGTGPSIASARGTVMEYVMGISYSRWAMEALAIKESQESPSHLQNGTMLFMKQLGLCEMDKMYVNNGDQVLDQDEADALLRLLEFQLEDCTSTFWQCVILVLLQGLLWRILALIGLQFGHRAKKV